MIDMMSETDFRVSRVDFCYKKIIDRTYSLDMQRRPCYGLTLIVSGGLVLTYEDGESLHAREGDIILQRKGDSYRMRSSAERTEYIVISYLAEPLEQFESLISFSRIVSTGERYSRYLDAFRRAAGVVGVCASPLLCAEVQKIICHLIRDLCSDADTSPEEQGIVATARRYIEESLSSPITVTEVAQAAGCSPSYLRELWREKLGTSPNRYINERKIERAREMLASRLFTVSETADACGFRNVYYFSRVFKEITGTTPGSYRIEL